MEDDMHSIAGSLGSLYQRAGVTPGATWYETAREQLHLMNTTPVWKPNFGKHLPETQFMYRTALASSKPLVRQPNLRPIIGVGDAAYPTDEGTPMVREVARLMPSMRYVTPQKAGCFGKISGTKKVELAPVTPVQVGTPVPAAKESARAASRSCGAAASRITAADLTSLSDLDAPSEALALLGAALLTLLAEGDTIPSDVRWPAVVAFVDADPDAALGAARAALRSYFNLSV